MKSSKWKKQKYRKCLSFRGFWGKKTQLEINMKIEIPLPSHCHFVVRWVFKQSTAFLFLFLSSASITKNQSFVPAGQTLILSKTSHQHCNSHHWWKKIHAVIHTTVYDLKKILNPEQRGKQSALEIPVNVSILLFYPAFFLSHPQIIHSSRGDVIQ